MFTKLFARFLERLNDPKVSRSIPYFFIFLGILLATQLRSSYEAIIFLIASLGQFTAYVFVSRLRQRGSYFWHAIAGLASNGTWYATSHILSFSKVYWLLFLEYLPGLIAGRLLGVALSQFVEKRYELKADASRDDKLAPGKRMAYITREPMFWTLLAVLTGYPLFAGLSGNPETFWIVVVIVLGIFQNFFYAWNTRASQRGNNWVIVGTGIASGVTFISTATLLFSRGLPLALAIPYIVSTAMGSTLGAFAAMIVEWTWKQGPDDHLKKKSPRTPEEIKKARLPYLVMLEAMAVWILFQEQIFRFFGLPVHELKFPIAAVTGHVPRILVFLTATTLFFLDSALHTVTSRAGNRNNTAYHLSTLIPKGLADFFKISYIALNDKFIDVIPVSILATCIGSLYGKDIGERIERRLQAVMDVPADKPSRFQLLP